jgi:hypothetical protein
MIRWAAILCVVALPALAFPLPTIRIDPALHAWFESQHDRDGRSCCAEADGHVMADEDVRFVEGHFEVRIGDAWMAVPERAMAQGPMNPLGHPVAWWIGEHFYCLSMPAGA